MILTPKSIKILKFLSLLLLTNCHLCDNIFLGDKNMSYIEKLNKNFFIFLTQKALIDLPNVPEYLRNNLDLTVTDMKLHNDKDNQYLSVTVKIDANHTITYYCTNNNCCCVGSLIGVPQQKLIKEIYLEELERQIAPFDANTSKDM